VDITTSLVRYAGKTVIQGIFRDVSERRKMEEERLLLSKLESLGLLAGGIAHDFNNILTAILGISVWPGWTRGGVANWKNLP